ncbi:hypothetical protein BB560_001692 [Smittium megazygosporum]|uniref:Sulfhydryl oxidase n=1 Tax=Smittium megazygosporum TaxID=133381 RepID=A0A2T9ZGW6_9FUNG|nr:hypothetical protein BB560_001692 [Smittium megazygosporum]
MLRTTRILILLLLIAIPTTIITLVKLNKTGELYDKQMGVLSNQIGTKRLNSDPNSKNLSIPKDALADLEGKAVMGKLVNETLRADLGRSTWYVLHVMASRYPKDPTETEKALADTFITSLSFLYPCGDCAIHFQRHLKKNPAQLSSRNDFEQWLCALHNVVNKFLKKPIFDCSTVHDKYDCGCGPDLVRYDPSEDTPANRDIKL